LKKVGEIVVYFEFICTYKILKKKMITDTIVMVRPKHFSYNKQTAASNAFQNEAKASELLNIEQQALKEFDELANKLKNEGVNVLVYEDTDKPLKSDAVFPNNWFTTHANGTICLYPMFTENRRTERRLDIVEDLKLKFKYNTVEDFSYFEIAKQYLEGTGSLILDRSNKLLYACLSPRTDKEAVETVAQKLAYQPIIFNAVDRGGKAIYHTNVMMSLAEEFVVICLVAIPNQKEKQQLLNHFADTGKMVIDITFEQMEQMAGNIIQLKNTTGQKIEVMSQTALNAFTDKQLTQILMTNKIVHSNISTIEKYGGGSARCMIAEVFKP